MTDPLRAALEQIKIVAKDNAATTVRHDLALEFVAEIAERALAAAPPAEVRERSASIIWNPIDSTAPKGRPVGLLSIQPQDDGARDYISLHVGKWCRYEGVMGKVGEGFNLSPNDQSVIIDTVATHWCEVSDLQLPSVISSGLVAPETFQSRVQPWMMACFGPEISADKIERNHRFLEEALELVQSTGCSQSEAHQLVDYVYGRPQGDINQEVGGVMVTLAALCLANGVDMHEGGEAELARVWTKVEQIRAKQAAKPKHSPLPGLVAPDTKSDVRLSASEQACYRWPEDTAEHRAMRAAYMDGAADYAKPGPSDTTPAQERREPPGRTTIELNIPTTAAERAAIADASRNSVIAWENTMEKRLSYEEPATRHRRPLYAHPLSESTSLQGRREALRLLAAEDDRQSKLHDLLETIREQIRLEVAPEHRPDGLFKNIQDAVYAMRGRTALMNDAAITTPLAMASAAYPEGVTQRDHIAHDIKQGRFPKQSSIEEFLSERVDLTCPKVQEQREEIAQTVCFELGGDWQRVLAGDLVLGILCEADFLRVADAILKPPFPLRFSAQWLERKIRADPDIETDNKEIFPPPKGEPSQPMQFFSENVDRWGAAEWFNRLADAVRGRNKAVLSKDEVMAEICNNVASSSASRLVNDYEQQVRAALRREPGGR